MQEFVDTFAPTSSTRVVDLGGSPELWRLIDREFAVTIVNLPGDWINRDGEVDGFEYVYADACDLSAEFADDTFDIVFSNSVIEHVGDAERRRAFAREVARLAPQHWIQTPSGVFPIEPHSGFPVFFLLPKRVRRAMSARWRETMPDFADMLDGTVAVRRREMRSLFPSCVLRTEWKFGFPKSWIAVTSTR